MYLTTACYFNKSGPSFHGEVNEVTLPRYYFRQSLHFKFTQDSDCDYYLQSYCMLRTFTYSALNAVFSAPVEGVCLQHLIFSVKLEFKWSLLQLICLRASLIELGGWLDKHPWGRLQTNIPCKLCSGPDTGLYPPHSP
jgi:hypothetical protein